MKITFLLKKGMVTLCLVLFFNSVFSQETLSTLKGITLRAVSFPSSEVGYAVGYNGIIIKTTDGGDKWTVLNTAYKKSLLTVHFFDKNTGVAAGDNQLIIRTTNGGKTWTKSECSNCQIPTAAFLQMHFFNEKYGVASGGQGLVAVTDDGGKSWRQIKVSTGKNVQFIQRFSKDELMAIAGTEVYRSTNAGKSFDQVELTNLHTQVMNGEFVDKNLGVAVGSQGSFYKTNDGGRRWERMTLGDKRTTFRAISKKGNSIFITGNFNGVLVSADGGETWATRFLQLADSGKTLYGISITEGGSVIVVGDDGFIYKSSDMGFSWRNVSYF